MLREIASPRSQLACETLKLLIVQLQNDWTSMACLVARESLFSLKQTWQHGLALETTTILYKHQQKHLIPTVKHNDGGLVICGCSAATVLGHLAVTQSSSTSYWIMVCMFLEDCIEACENFLFHDFRLNKGKESQKDFNRKITINYLLAYKNLCIWHLPSLHPKFK